MGWMGRVEASRRELPADLRVGVWMLCAIESCEDSLDEGEHSGGS